MKKSTLIICASLSFLIGSQCAVSLTKETSLDDLVPTIAHKRSTDLITHFISNYHYKKTPLDDYLSNKILDKYLESLDPNRSFFLASDIKDFKPYRKNLDDALRKADLKPAFNIFKTFRRRLDERVSFVLKQIKETPDFSIDEEYIFDRTESPWPENTQAQNELWRKRLKNEVLSLKLSEKKPDEIKDLLKKRYESLSRRTHQLNSEDVFQFFMNSYTTSIEPHTSYFSPRTSENFDIQMRLSLEGIGAVLQSENEFTIVKQIIVGGPADTNTQLQPEDKIVGVGQDADKPIVDVVGWRLDDVVDLIRGPKDSIVRLEVIPKSSVSGDTRKTITLTRNKINLEEQAAKSFLIEIPGEEEGLTTTVGVIDLPTFYLDFAALARGDDDYRSSTRDTKKLLKDLEKDNIDGLIIDLRSNGGGSLLEATGLTGLFIETGPVVQVKDAIGRIEVNDDSDPDIAYSGPVAVLVDRYSASASEIFAGAIQDYRRGIIIGEPTFGKGTVQNLIDLNQYDDRSDNSLGHLKTTIAQFFRISGNSTQHRGVVPDVIYPTVTDTSEYGERAYNNALPWSNVTPATYQPALAPVEVFAKARWQHERRIAKDPAFQLLIEDIATINELQKKQSVSLSEKKRQSERDGDEKKSDERKAQYKRIANSTPSLIKNREESKAVRSTEEDEDAPEVDQGDILLVEAARILNDLINNSQQKPQLVNQ